MRIVLASNNAGKLRELTALFASLGLELVAQGALGIAEAEEPHRTFLENALAKARHASRESGCAAIADDSGLCVDALGGEPGVTSAVYAQLADGGSAGAGDRETQRRRQDDANNARLVAALDGVSDRRGRFVSTLVALRSADDPEPLVAVGRWDASIVSDRRGEAGFGYDPHVFVPALGRTVAELDAATKNVYSHRAQAAASMRELLRVAWRLGG